MQNEKSYVETERMREQSELGRKEEKIVNCVDISDNQKVFIKFSTVTYRNLLKWVIIGGISGILMPFFQVAMLGVIISVFCCFSILMTILFNGIRTVELKENTFVTNVENEDIDYKSLEYFIITTYSGDFLAYRNNKNYWRTISEIAFPSQTIQSLLKNHLLDRIPVSKEIINSGGEEVFGVRSEEDIKADYRKRDFLGKRRDRVYRAMRDKVVPLDRLQNEVHKVFENPNNKLIIKKEGLVVDSAIYPWNRLQSIKVSRNFGGMLEIKTREDEIIFSERATAVVKLPLFEALYNSMVFQK
ncbi:regulator [Leptotrichia wadei]|uniref:Uncharacterized protein n=1 Tax=Leptotrichia wadei TaxID=157687 RepID=A0A510KI63_9FUSO|nr:regulator [Leptotrichia wadei]BBM50927.1 hypothetical protein JMUB3934_2249 [Leptotrichia wadei]